MINAGSAGIAGKGWFFFTGVFTAYVSDALSTGYISKGHSQL